MYINTNMKGTTFIVPRIFFFLLQLNAKKVSPLASHLEWDIVNAEKLTGSN